MPEKLMAIILSLGLIAGIGIVGTGSASAAPKPAPSIRFPTHSEAPISSTPNLAPAKSTNSQIFARTFIQLIPVLGSYFSTAAGTPTQAQAKIINSLAVGAISGALTGGVGAAVYGFTAGTTLTITALIATVVSGTAVGATGAGISQWCKLSKVAKVGLC